MSPTPAYTHVAPLIAFFERMLPLTEDEKQLLAAKFQPRSYRRRQFALQDGDVCTAFNFVVEGCLRMYKVDAAGTIHTIQFAIEHWWIADLGSFYSMQASELCIEAIEPTTVLQVRHADLLDIYEQSHKFNRLFRVLVENSLIALQQRLLQNFSTDAGSRYAEFLSQYPGLANRVPNTHIASYLGITPEFLSKIRKQRAGH